MKCHDCQVDILRRENGDLYCPECGETLTMAERESAHPTEGVIMQEVCLTTHEGVEVDCSDPTEEGGGFSILDILEPN